MIKKDHCVQKPQNFSVSVQVGGLKGGFWFLAFQLAAVFETMWEAQ